MTNAARKSSVDAATFFRNHLPKSAASAAFVADFLASGVQKDFAKLLP